MTDAAKDRPADEPKGVFEGAGAPPPPPSRTTDSAGLASAAPLPESALGRFTFTALIPSLLLPVLATLTALASATGGSGANRGIEWLVVGAFCLVLLGSMALNAWLLLRHPETWRLRALPKGIAVVLLLLWCLLIVGAIVVAVIGVTHWAVIIAFALMALSIIVFVAALVRKAVKTAVAPLVAVGLSRYATVLGWGYLVLVVIEIFVGVYAVMTASVAGLLVALVLVGLPWSWPLAALGLLLGAFSTPFVGYVFAALIVASVVFNVIAVVRLLTNAAFRVRFVNWFFKLRGDDPRTTIRTAAAVPPV